MTLKYHRRVSCADLGVEGLCQDIRRTFDTIEPTSMVTSWYLKKEDIAEGKVMFLDFVSVFELGRGGIWR